ncbi:hypothetical protein [Phyllobacterium sp. OV277]|uniref:hypothetical protein n=1 Tax=Phyllobacterium sp. OV277 TaxID=1882772 RepID=UPI00088D2C35|nr:hypothetical protein [Phyllobacterium sp. OV277]SDP80178.1 hypothetical protein SAMN05443582_110122 [Phyllobacterium sp. OV277]
MKIKIALSLLFSLIPALVFPLMLTLGTFSFVQPSFAKNCYLTSPAGISTSIDVFEGSLKPIVIPDMEFKCERDIPTKQWKDDFVYFCFRIEPSATQRRDNHSFNLVMKDNTFVELGFQLQNRYREDEYISTNDTSLKTYGIAPGLKNFLGGFFPEEAAAKAHLSNIELKPLLKGSQFLNQAGTFAGYSLNDNQTLLQAGTYAGSYRLWVYQLDDIYFSNSARPHGCETLNFTSRSMLGTIDISITVKKNCLLENKTDINFGAMASSVAMNQPEAEGSIIDPLHRRDTLFYRL